MNSATLKIAVEVDDKGSIKLKQLGDTVQESGRKGEDGAKRMGRSLGAIDGLAGKAVGALKGVAVAGAAIGGAAVVGGLYMLAGALRESVQLASDMEEAQSKFDTVFGELSGQAEQWAATLKDSYHMSSLEAKKYLAAMQDLLVPMGMNSEAAAAMSFEVVKLSADLGSFNNLPTAQVMDDIQSALVGNYETMKKYGVVVNAANVEEKALAMGLAATKDAITAADKAQAAYTLIVEGSTFALGDSIRTAGSFANQMKDLSSNLTELKIAAGEALLPVINKLVTGINDWVTANEDLIKSELKEWVEKLIPLIEGLAKAALWVIDEIVKLANTHQILMAVKDGHLELWEAAKMGPQEAADWLRKYHEEEGRFDKNALVEKIELHKSMLGTMNLSSEAREFYTKLLREEQAEYDLMTGGLDNLTAGLESYYTATGEATTATGQSGEAHGKTSKEIEKHANELQKLLDKYLPLKKEAEEVAAAEKGLKELLDAKKITAEEYALALENVRKSTTQYKEDEKALAEAIKKTEERVKEKQEAEEGAVKAAAELSKAYMDIYGELADSSAAMSQASYEAQVEALDKQLEAYRKMGVDEDVLRELRLKRTREIDKKMLMSSGGFFGGVVAAAMDAEDAMRTMADVGHEAFNMLSDTFSDTFVAVMKGEFEDIGDLWESLLDSMLDMFIRFIADLIAQWVMSGVIGMLTGNGLGGISLNMNGSGGGFNLGSAASMASPAYSMYTGNSLGGAAAYAAYSYLYPQTTVAPYGYGASQYLGQSAVAQQTAQQTSTAMASQTPTTSSTMSAAAPYMASAAFVAALAWSFYSFQKGKMEPTPADMYNQMGLRPENFAHLIGQEFQRTVVPVFGEVTAKWDQASNSMVMLADQEKYKAQRERDVDRDIYSERGIKTMTWDASSPTWRVQVESMVEAALRGGGFGQLGITPRTMEEFAAALERMNVALDPSTIKGIWEWGQATQTSTEKVKLAFEDLSLGGAQMVRAMELLERAATSASASTEELEKYLRDLGYTQEQVSTALQEFSGSEISRMRVMGEAAMSPLMEAARAMGLVFDDLEGSTMSSVRSVDRFGNVIEHLPGNAAADSVELLNETMGELPGYFADAASAVNTFSGSLTGLHEIATGTATMNGNTPVAMAMNGGPIGYLSGGILRGGSGTRDDLYLGHVNGRAQLAQGGEYIINKDSTRKHRAALDIINADRYATGGPVAEDIFQFVRSLITGNLPSPDDGIKGVGNLPSTTRSSRTADDLKKLQEIMADVAESMMLMEATDLEKAFYESDKKFKEMAEEARKLGASEADLIEIEKLRLATNAEIMAEHKKAQASFMQDINDQISAFSMSDMELAIRDTVRAMEEAIEKAKELGLSEAEIAKIRELQALRAADIIEQQRRAQSDFMQDINDQISAFSMSDMEKALLDNRRAMEEALKQAEELGLGESDLARVRELYGKRAQEIMNQGLAEAITSMESFKTSLAGASGESLKSAAAQQDLFDILSQARAGDFSGVEKIGDVLRDISINKDSYATAADYARDYWRTMSAVSELEQITTAQVQPPGFADGGEFGGGWRLVGEQGPELEYTGPSRIYSNEQSRELVDLSEVVAEIRELRQDLAATGYQGIKNSSKTSRILERWDAIGLPPERAAA